MNIWQTIEPVLVLLLVGGSAAFVLRAAWRALPTLSRPAATHDGCRGCGGHCAGSRNAAPGDD